MMLRSMMLALPINSTGEKGQKTSGIKSKLTNQLVACRVVQLASSVGWSLAKVKLARDN